MIGNVPAVEMLGRVCAKHNVPFAFNLAGDPCIRPPFFKNIMDTIEHADFIFCNEFEIDIMTEQFKTKDRLSTAKHIAKY